MNKLKQSKQSISPVLTAAIDQRVEAAVASKLALAEKEIYDRVVSRLEQECQAKDIVEHLHTQILEEMTNSPSMRMFNPLAGP